MAAGSGYAAQAADYYFVGQGIAGMPLPYDVKRVLDSTDVYQTNADSYAAHTNEYWQKAIDAYTEAIKLDDTYANAYNLRGIARQRIRPAQMTGAEEDFARAIALGERHYGAFWNLGIALYNNGKFEQAETAARTAMELNPGICGPAYTLSLAVLAQGELDRASELYEQATAQCDQIYRDALDRKEQPPASLWGSMETAADDLDNFLCVLATRHCYPNRALPKLGTLAISDAVIARAEALRKRVKEAFTKLEFQGTIQVTPTGAKFTPIKFGYYIINPDDTNQFLSYAEKDSFPYNEFSPAIESFSYYSNMQSDYFVAWKVRRDGVEDPGLRFAEKWNLKTEGDVVRQINSWYVLLPGLYEMEVYVNGELVQTGSFQISPRAQLTNALPEGLKPTAPVLVGKLLMHETFDNNNANWWTGTPANQEEGDIVNELQIVTHDPERTMISSCSLCSATQDFYVEADTRKVSGPDDRGYGLVYRAVVDFKSFYAFLISENGNYYIGRYDGSWTPLVNWSPTDRVNVGATNQLAIRCEGPRCEFFINGVKVNQVEDATLTNTLVGVRSDTADLKVAFDNVNLWSLQ